MIEETRMSHVGKDVMIDAHLTKLVCDHYDLLSKPNLLNHDSIQDKDCAHCNDDEEDGYGIIQPKSTSVQDVAQALSRCATNGKGSSVFDDSDYEEVLDFIQSSDYTTKQDRREQFLVAPLNEDDISNSSKRSSTTSASSSTSSSTSIKPASTSGVESGEENTGARHPAVDIAKILHTRKRIHRILQNSSEKIEEPEVQPQNCNTGYVTIKKKGSYLSKRYTHYGSIGRQRKSSSASRRHSSTSGATCCGDSDCEQRQPRKGLTFDPLQSHPEESGDGSSSDTCFSNDTQTDCSRNHNSDEDTVSSSVSGRGESKRLSRFNSNATNGDEAPATPPQGRWKTLRKLVNNGNRPPTQAEQKELISVPYNSNNYMKSDINAKHLSSVKSKQEPKTDKKTRTKEVIDASSEYNHSSRESSRASAPGSSTNSLLRRLSRKSSNRGRSPKNSNRSSENVSCIRSDSLEAKSFLNRTDSPAGRFQYGDGAQRLDIEAKVMESVKRRDNNEKTRKDQSKSSSKSSFKKKFFSLKRKRTHSQSKKAAVKPKEEKPEGESGKMNKALSFSSPQLSVFATNTDKNRNGFTQKLAY